MRLHLPVCRVDHVYYGVCVAVVAPPVRPDARLTAQVPHLELEIFVRHLKGEGGGREIMECVYRGCLKCCTHLFHIETYRRYCRDYLAHLQAVQDGRFSGPVQSQN